MFDADRVQVEPRLAGLDPVVERRRSGDRLRIQSLGVTLTFVQMPCWRLSYWEGVLGMPAGETSLFLTFEVERDEPPHAAHELIVFGARRMQPWQTARALPLINRALLECGRAKVEADDCALTSIRVGADSLVNYDLGFKVRAVAGLTFIVSHVGTKPTRVRVDSNESES